MSNNHAGANPENQTMPDQDSLSRSVGLTLLSLYGLGTILGAGIYVLVGKVGSAAGIHAPLAFMLAALVAWMTALSYSQLVVIFPRSAGEAIYIEKAMGIRQLTILVGLLIIFAGIVSSATLATGFVGYFKILIPVNDTLGILLIITVMTLFAVWGISQSLLLSGLITLIEISGILLVIFFNIDVLKEVPAHLDAVLLPGDLAQITGIVSGAFIAFYAFIGFEDMVNIVEEVKQPSTNMPKAILIAVMVSSLLYILVAFIAILAFSTEQLANHEAPLAELIRDKFAHAETLLAIIGMFAIVNGVLIQLIMASRVIFGMARDFNGPHILYKVNPKTKTPVYATLLSSALVILFATSLPLELLARLTSFIILVVFLLVNLSLVILKNDKSLQDEMHLRSWPQLAATLCLFLLIFQILEWTGAILSLNP